MTTEQIDRIEKKLEKIDDILLKMAVSVSNTEERLHHVPTKSDMLLAIKSHWDQCSSKRTTRNRWMIGFLVGIPAVVLGIFEIFNLF